MRYEFIVNGLVSDAYASELPELASTPYPTGGTVLFGPIQDEADAFTMRARILSLGFSVIEMRRLPD